MRRWLLIAAFAVAGCGGDTACTDIGCDHGIAIDSGDLAYASGQVRALRVCVDDRCQTVRRRVTDFGPDLDHGRRSAGTVKLTAELLGAGGRRLHRSELPVELGRRTPNGEGCDPVCIRGSAFVDRRGDLLGSAPRPDRFAVRFRGRAFGDGDTVRGFDANFLFVDTPRPARRVEVRPAEPPGPAGAFGKGGQRWIANVATASQRLRFTATYADGSQERMTVRVRTP